jgi:hypothetical protein
MPFKAIGLLLLVGFLLGFAAVPIAQSLEPESSEYRSAAAER